ncbi:hypothetical protein P4T48_00960 [Bacillus paramycoides]|nr:hypothetical protein [Bacillus paramycoides]
MKLAKTQIQQFISKQLELCELKELNVDLAVRGLDFDPNMFIRAGEIGFYRLVCYASYIIMGTSRWAK